MNRKEKDDIDDKDKPRKAKPRLSERVSERSSRTPRILSGKSSRTAPVDPHLPPRPSTASYCLGDLGRPVVKSRSKDPVPMSLLPSKFSVRASTATSTSSTDSHDARATAAAIDNPPSHSNSTTATLNRPPPPAHIDPLRKFLPRKKKKKRDSLLDSLNTPTVVGSIRSEFMRHESAARSVTYALQRIHPASYDDDTTSPIDDDPFLADEVESSSADDITSHIPTSSTFDCGAISAHNTTLSYLCDDQFINQCHDALAEDELNNAATVTGGYGSMIDATLAAYSGDMDYLIEDEFLPFDESYYLGLTDRPARLVHATAVRDDEYQLENGNYGNDMCSQSYLPFDEAYYMGLTDDNDDAISERPLHVEYETTPTSVPPPTTPNRTSVVATQFGRVDYSSSDGEYEDDEEFMKNLTVVTKECNREDIKPILKVRSNKKDLEGDEINSEPPNKKVTFDLTLYMEKCNPTDDRSVFTGNPLDSDSDSEITPIINIQRPLSAHYLKKNSSTHGSCVTNGNVVSSAGSASIHVPVVDNEETDYDTERDSENEHPLYMYMDNQPLEEMDSFDCACDQYNDDKASDNTETFEEDKGVAEDGIISTAVSNNEPSSTVHVAGSCGIEDREYIDPVEDGEGQNGRHTEENDTAHSQDTVDDNGSQEKSGRFSPLSAIKRGYQQLMKKGVPLTRSLNTRRRQVKAAKSFKLFKEAVIKDKEAEAKQVQQQQQQEDKPSTKSITDDACNSSTDHNDNNVFKSHLLDETEGWDVLNARVRQLTQKYKDEQRLKEENKRKDKEAYIYHDSPKKHTRHSVKLRPISIHSRQQTENIFTNGIPPPLPPLPSMQRQRQDDEEPPLIPSMPGAHTLINSLRASNNSNSSSAVEVERVRYEHLMKRITNRKDDNKVKVTHRSRISDNNGDFMKPATPSVPDKIKRNKRLLQRKKRGEPDTPSPLPMNADTNGSNARTRTYSMYSVNSSYYRRNSSYSTGTAEASQADSNSNPLPDYPRQQVVSLPPINEGSSYVDLMHKNARLNSTDINGAGKDNSIGICNTVEEATRNTSAKKINTNEIIERPKQRRYKSRSNPNHKK